MDCPYCGGDDVDYIGVADGGGPYGTSVCDEWMCHTCGVVFDAGCIEYEDDDIEIEGREAGR